jgi:hypothetical protein
MPGFGTIEDLIISQEAELELAMRNRDRALGEVKAILGTAKQENRSNLTPSEDEDIRAAQERFARENTNIAGIEHKLEISRKTKAAEMAVDEQLAVRQASGAPLPDNMTESDRRGIKRAYDEVARVGREERTYHKGNTGRGGPFLQDVVNMKLFGDMQATARLQRHMQEERVERGQYLERAAGTGAFSGLTVPQYLTEMYAPAVSNLQPFAEACNRHDLPASGMTVNISQITTATSVALQTSENSSVSNTDIDDTLLSINVQTAAGQQTLSRQAIERGTGIEGVVMDDLFRRYAATKDSTLINQATTGLDAVSQAVSYADTTPTSAELWPKLLGAAAGVETALLGYGSADIAVMHSRRWFWMQSQLTNAWPLISQPGLGGLGNGNSMGVSNGRDYGQGARGVLPSGLVVITDNNISTTKGGGTEDRIYVASSQECHLWEDANAPVFIRAEQPAAASLGVLLVLYGYFAYTFARYANSVQSIQGTGLAAPTF